MSSVIQLDNYEGQYNAGDVIIGKVVCLFNKSKNIRGINVKLKGEEQNSWTSYRRRYDHRRKRSRRRAVHLKGHETFLHLESSLHGEGEIGPGRFEFPFTFELPLDLPSTYQGRHGGINFTIEVRVDRPYKFDYTDTMQIVVASPINLNRIKDTLHLLPTSYSVDETICCWCCTSDPLTMEVHLEREAFVVGEIVRIRVETTNMSNQNIERVNVQLGMQTISMVTHPHNATKYDYELWVNNSESGVGAHGQRTYQFNLHIPQSANVQNFNLCQLFRQQAKLQVTAVLPGCYTNMDVEAYLTVGEVPLDVPQGQAVGPIGFASQEVDAGPSAPPPEAEASAPLKETLGINQSDPFELPPPSYIEATSQSRQQ